VPRVVLDVNVLVSAYLTPRGIPARILGEWLDGRLELVVSSKLLDELDRALAYEKVRRRSTDVEAREFVSRLRARADLVEDPRTVERVVLADPGDDYVVALARAAEAHVIVTGDAHLLRLVDLRPPAYSPSEFLVRLLRQS
jgi:putative PIN family toxin of toxin-antitoxin system